MEIAKFVFTAIGTFLSVFGLSFTVFQHWKKRQDEKFDLLKKSIDAAVQKEVDSRKEAVSQIRERVEKLDEYVSQRFENRLSRIEGKLEGMNNTLNKITDWFINTPPRTK